MCFNHLWLVAPPFFFKEKYQNRKGCHFGSADDIQFDSLPAHSFEGGKKKCPCFRVRGRLRWSLDGLPAAKTTPAPSSE